MSNIVTMAKETIVIEETIVKAPYEYVVDAIAAMLEDRGIVEGYITEIDPGLEVGEDGMVEFDITIERTLPIGEVNGEANGG